MAFFAISFAASVIRVLMNSLILSMMLAFASSSGKEGGDLAIIFLRAFRTVRIQRLVAGRIRYVNRVNLSSKQFLTI